MKLVAPNGEIVSAGKKTAAALLEQGYKEHKPPKSGGGGSAGSGSGSDKDPAFPDTHAALDALAEKIDGFEWPEPPEGKQKLTVAQKIEALKAAGYEPSDDDQ